MGCYVSAGVSGAHLNPAVTLAPPVHRKLPWAKVGPHVLAQCAGAFVASFVVFITYREAIGAFDGGVRQILGPQGTAGIWATYPSHSSARSAALVDQIVGTALLVAVIFGITDARNSPPPAGLTPVVGPARRADRRHASASTPGMRSTRRAISVRVCSRRWPGGAAASSPRATAGGGCRSSDRSIGGVIGGWAYDACVGRWLEVDRRLTSSATDPACSARTFPDPRSSAARPSSLPARGMAGVGVPRSATARKRLNSEAGICRQLSQNFGS